MLFGIFFGRPLQDYDVKPSNATFQSRRFRELFHFILFKVELLLEIEESLPKWILRRVQVDKHEEFPNRSSKLQTKVRKLQNCLERKLVNREMFVMVCFLMPVYIINLFVYLFGFF